MTLTGASQDDEGRPNVTRNIDQHVGQRTFSHDILGLDSFPLRAIPGQRKQKLCHVLDLVVYSVHMRSNEFIQKSDVQGKDKDQPRPALFGQSNGAFLRTYAGLSAPRGT